MADHGHTKLKKETAKEFVTRIEAEGKALSKEVSAAYWVRNTYITDDTAILAAKAGERSLAFESSVVAQAKLYKDTKMDTADNSSDRVNATWLIGTCTQRP